MATFSLDARPNNLQTSKSHGVVVEQIEGLIRVYRDGLVERPPIVPIVSSAVASDLLVTRDIIINKLTNLWARVYAPNRPPGNLMPLLIYFHGGGFCVGSAAWSCYHYFLSNLASRGCCVIVSVNYRLAPENRLPAAYEDGLNAMTWVSQQAQAAPPEQSWWLSRSNLSRLFLAGDSAGANIAYNVALRAGSGSSFRPLSLKGAILIQPFFGGEARTESEKFSTQPANSALTLSASDAYWRLALPVGTSRDHPWCNPLSAKPASFGLPAVMVCVSEMDVLKDRNIEFCNVMTSLGKRVEKVVYKDVGHAFQVLHNSPFSELRTQEMMSHLRAFINH